MEKVELGKFNEFECQVSPDHGNHHLQLRAKAILNVIGKCNSTTTALVLQSSATAKTIKRKGYF